MIYLGNKSKIAKEILPIILKGRGNGQCFVDTFCGGANITARVKGDRIANDQHYYLIKMWQELSTNDNLKLPDYVSAEEYKDIKDNPDSYPDWYVGYVGFNSFGGKWWGGYKRCSLKTHYFDSYKKNILNQIPNLKGVVFKNLDFTELEIPKNAIIYNDPPYQGTTKYKGQSSMDYDIFWDWVREKSKNHKVFTSEYSAPPDFKEVWQKEVTVNINHAKGSTKPSVKRVEKLFVHEHLYKKLNFQKYKLF